MGSSAVIDIVSRTSRFNARMGKVIRTMETVRKRMESVARAARRMLIAATAAATGAVVVFARFEQEMARVRGLTSATADEFERLNQSARDLGKSTIFSATQAAQAMGAFALQGFKTNEIIKAMPATLDLAAAGQLGMGQAAAITAGIMKGMKLEAKDLTHVVDVLTVAATSSATDIPQLGQAMRAIGPVARASGLSIEETVAIIRGMSDVMIQGAAAGIALRNVLLRLQKNSQEVKKRMDELGLSVADANGNMKDMPTIIDELNAALATKDQVTRSAIVTDIAGLRAAAAFTEILELGGDRIRQYTKELQDSEGAARRLAAIQQATLLGSFKLLTSAVSELAIKIGGAFKPAIEAAVAAVKKLVEWFSKLDSATLKLTISLGALALVLAGFGIPAVLLGLKALAFAFTGLATASAVLAAVWAALSVSLSVFAIEAGVIAVGLASIGLTMARLKRQTIELEMALGGVSRGFKEVAAARKESAEAETTDEQIAALERKARGLRLVAFEVAKEGQAIVDNEAQFTKSQRKSLALSAIGRSEKATRQAEDVEKRIAELKLKGAKIAEDAATKEQSQAVDSALLQRIEALELRKRQTAQKKRWAERKAALAGWLKGIKDARAEYDAQVKAAKDSLLTDKQRLAIEIQRFGVMRAAGDITQQEHDNLVKMAKLRAAPDKPRSLAGQFEGLTDTFRRIQSSVTGGKTQSPAVAIRKLSDQQQRLADRKEARDKAHQELMARIAARTEQLISDRLHLGFA